MDERIQGRQHKRAEVRVPVSGIRIRFEGSESSYPLLDISSLGVGVAAPSGAADVPEACAFLLWDEVSGARVQLSGEVRFREKQFLGIRFSEAKGVRSFLEQVLSPAMMGRSLQAVKADELPPGVREVYRGNGIEILFFQEDEEAPVSVQICWKGAVVELSESGDLEFVPLPLVLASGVTGGSALAVELGEVNFALEEVREGLESLLEHWPEAPQLFRERLKSQSH